MKRIGLFIMTNLAIMVMISLVVNLLGIQPYLNQKGINYQSLMIFCAIWGSAGAFISLLLSRQMAKWTMGVKVIDPMQASSQAEQWLVQTVYTHAKAAGLPKMPEVGIYQSSDLNAFATGPSKSKALVAVSTGLLSGMNRDEVEGVVAHEIAHIANNDMVTMTLIQGVVNAFVMFLARIAAFGVSQFLRKDDEEASSSGWLQFGLVFLFDILFGILGSLIVNGFSRAREFRADSGGARLAGRTKMIQALERLSRQTHSLQEESGPMAAFKIAGKSGGVMRFFMTHPPLDTRIERLKMMVS